MFPDAKHIHQLIFSYIKNKYDLDIFFVNTFTGQIINIYNFIIFLISLNFIANSKIQIFLILFNIVIYTLVYYKLFKFRYRKSI